MTDPTPLPTTDSTASTGAQTVGSVIQGAEAPVEAAIIAAAPGMATPVFMQLWEWALGMVFTTIGNVIGKLFGYAVIDVQEYEALQNSAAALTALRAAQTSGDASAITTANTNADAAIATAIHFTGSIST